MSTIHWLSPDEQGEWDAFVTRHPLGLVYHLSSWQRVLESAFGHIRGRFLVLRDGGGQIQAGLPVYMVTSWLLGNRTVSVPFATMCDPLISTKEEFSFLWLAIEDASGKHRSQRIEIRTRRISTDCMPPLLTASARYKHHYLPLGENTDALFRSFHQSCVRRRVEKARRAGVVVEERQDEQSLRVFHALLVATRRRLSLPPMPFAFFQAMYRWLSPDRAALYMAVHAGEPVGGLLALKFKDLWTMEYTGDADNATPGTNQLLCWETIQRAKSSGAGCFSFGRTSLDNTGLLDYKRRWATVEEDLTDFISPPGATSAQADESLKSVNRAFYVTTKRLLRYAPAAVQKSFGDFCYRHLG
jgi:CelD/BcsL family acetyltransferase involved in cellulose biosynthesis